MAVQEQAPKPHSPAGVSAAGRAHISARTLRKDRWWILPLTEFVVLTAFVVYATWAAFINNNYFYEPYISPFYSPCLATSCTAAGAPSVGIFGTWWAISPAIIILIIPLGFRLTCYYYRKAYYRSFWLSPAACAVPEPRKHYTGETRFPLIFQNAHRYFFYLGFLLNIILTYDAIIAFRNHDGQWGHMGLGTLILVINAVLLWMYTLTCHSCRNIMGGRLNHFSKHPIRYKLWTWVSRWNTRHGQFAWMSLIWVAWADIYVRLLAADWIHDVRFF